MWEASVYNYNVTRWNVIFAVNPQVNSRYMPFMLLAQKNHEIKIIFFTVNRCYVAYSVGNADRPIRARLWRT